MNNKSKAVRNGFTLVELLIVIVVIGTLAAMMMMSSTEVVATSKANNIITGLQMWKKAALAYYADNIDTWSEAKTGGSTASGNNIITADVAKYLSVEQNTTSSQYQKYDSDTPYFVFYDGTGRWWVACWLWGYAGHDEKATEDNLIATKLAGRAKTLGLKKCNGDDDNDLESNELYDGSANADMVALKIR